LKIWAQRSGSLSAAESTLVDSWAECVWKGAMLAKEGVLAGAEAALAQTAGDVGSRESHTVGRQVRLVGGRHDPVYEGAGGGMVRQRLRWEYRRRRRCSRGERLRVERFQTTSGVGGALSGCGRRDGSVRGLPRSGIGGSLSPG
jgi:hypothetical protein